MPKVSRRLQSARFLASNMRSYLATPLWSMIPVEAKDMPHPMGVDKYWRLYYNPDLIDQWDTLTCAGVLFHELYHLLRDHADRAKVMNIGQANHMAWNVACDAEINDDLLGEEILLPADCITPAKLNQPDGKLAEWYYRQFPTRVGGGGDPSNGNGSNGDGQGVPAEGEGTSTNGAGGSCADGQTKKWEQGEPTKDKPGISKGRHDLLKRKTAEAIKDFVKSRGTVAGHWERWADEVVSPKVSWQKELSANVRNAVAYQRGMIDYTYRRPSRRQSIFPRIVQPSMVAPVPRLAVIVDTSYSMRDEQTSQALGEIKGILKSIGCSEAIPVLSCDAEVHNAQKVFSAKQVSLTGGGGTDMGIGMEACAALRPKPDIVICLTDMLTPWPSEAPPYKFLVVGLGAEEDASWKAPAYAKTIYVPEG